MHKHASNAHGRFSQFAEDSLAAAIKYHNSLGKTFLYEQYYNNYHYIDNLNNSNIIFYNQNIMKIADDQFLNQFAEA